MIECMRNVAKKPQEEPMGMTDEAKEEIQIVLSLLKSTLTKKSCQHGNGLERQHLFYRYRCLCFTE